MRKKFEVADQLGRSIRSSLWTSALIMAAGCSAVITSASAATHSGKAASMVMGGGKLDPRLAGARGSVAVWVSLAEESVASYRAGLSTAAPVGTARAKPEAGQLRARSAVLRRSQDAASGRLAGFGAREIGRVHVAHNAIAVTVDASQLEAISALPEVARVRPVLNYEKDLTETVPYIGAAAARADRDTGRGVRVAVLDSGIDYTHRNLGGDGSAASYAAAVAVADAASVPAEIFPTRKVVGGYDFVGSTWPTGERTEDANPIDDGPDGGHGTHVADIIAGRSNDRTHFGVAPGASLVAVKVCSSVSTSCNGVALLKGMDYALDPNGDGSMDDRVDVINLSLGSSYGQIEDDLTLAVSNAVGAGVVVVASAGNSANRPYIVGSPSIAAGAIAVAQTQVPSAKAFPAVINAPAALAGSYGNTESVPFAPVVGTVSGDVVFAGLGCTPITAPVAGKIALINRGTCSVSLKVDAAAKAGATGVLLGLIAPGDAVSFSFGGGTTFVPTLVIQQSLSNALQAALTAGATVNATISDANAIALVGGMVGSSSRGPTISGSRIKPEIGAPGASVSAIYGTGNGEEAFGGTSGAAPMVAGSAAILLGDNPHLTPVQVKALLMNSAETAVYTNRATQPGVRAPVMRIGAGEVRVDRALELKAAAYSEKDESAALSFGFVDVAQPVVLEAELRLENYARRGRSFALASSFRGAAQAASGAVNLLYPSNVFVGGRDATTIKVVMTIDPSRLPAWPTNWGINGGNGPLLDALDYDGNLTLSSGKDQLSVPFHVLPRRASKLSASDEVQPGGSIRVRNRGAADGVVEAFALIGKSRPQPRSARPAPGDNFALIDLKSVGARVLGTNLQIAVDTFGRRAVPVYPSEIDVYVDSNNDGVFDYVVYQSEATGFAATGQSIVFVGNLTTGTASAFFANDADLQSGSSILTAPLAALGITDPTKPIRISVRAFDNYFTGNQTDAIEDLSFAPGLLRATATATSTVPAGGTIRIATTAPAGGEEASPAQPGILLLYRANDRVDSQSVRLK